MEEDRESTRYWCYECNRSVLPILGIETVKCSSCNGDFVEEMESVTNDLHHDHLHEQEGVSDPDIDPDRALSLWAPILLGMMSNPDRRRMFRNIGFEEYEEDEDRRRYQFHNLHERRESDLDHEFGSNIRRRRGSPAAIARFLHGVRAGMVSDSEINTDREDGADGNRGRVILINPFNQTVIVQGGGNASQTHSIGSLGDYFTGTGLELLLQHLAENDPNRYGTPPAKKEAVEALPNVLIEENSVQCSVCLDDFEAGTEAKEMPCKHRYHSKCIMPWLELHSSCPVCRFELPSDESKLNQERDGSTSSDSENGGSSRRFSVSLPWPLSNLFSSTSGPETGSSVTSTSASGSGSGSSSSTRARREEDGH